MGKMKANRKFIEADDRAVSAVIGVILMVAITVAIAATVYVYVSGMIGGTKNQTPNIACTTDSTLNKVQVATADANIKWKDIVVNSDNVGVTWGVFTASNTVIDSWNHTSAATLDVTAGDYVLLKFNNTATPPTNVRITLRYIPTNSLLGTWTINV